jgi:hypothetical protein
VLLFRRSVALAPDLSARPIFDGGGHLLNHCEPRK